MKKVLTLLVLVLSVQLMLCERSQANCTIGVAHESVASDSRPLLWKSRMWSGDNLVVHISGPEYDYIGVKSMGATYTMMGLNSTGLCTGNSYVSRGNGSFMEHILGNFSTVEQVREYIAELLSTGQLDASGCFPFIDAAGNATMFEINNSNWVIEYDTLDPDRILQGMYGWVVRANEWHQNADGTDDPITTGRYYSGIFNIGGLIDENLLSAETIMQGNNGADGYEFMRYGPYRPLATIAQPTVCSSMIVHGVAPRENPVLSTMWTALGQANYAIAVPTWVHVSEIPPCLGNGDMAVVVNLLEYVGNETVTQASVFPVEAHLFDEVAELMTRWRRSPSLALRDMGRVETRMADDAYSLLYCLAHVQPDNQAPTVTIRISPQSKCYVQLMGDGIAIDNLSVFLPPSYKYEDDFSTTKAEKDSYDHSAFWPEMAFPPPYPYLFYTHAVQPSGALAFVDYDNVYAHLAYCFPLHHLTSVTDSLHPRRGIMKLEVFDLGDGYGAYSLSGDGVHWTLPMPLEFGAQAITLDPGAGYSYRFVATAEDEDGTIEEYLWDFGDGETASGVSAWHTYDAPGWYLVSCTVTDDDGVSITDWRYLYVRRWIAHEIYPHEVATGGGG